MHLEKKSNNKLSPHKNKTGIDSIQKDNKNISDPGTKISK
jgi:hypothetical protein